MPPKDVKYACIVPKNMKMHVNTCKMGCNFFHTENVGSGMALAKTLHAKTDVRPDLKGGAWRWSEASPFPPLSAILRCPLWADDIYKPHRDMLLRAVPVPQLDDGGTFITLKVTGERKSSAAVPLAQVCTSTF